MSEVEERVSQAISTAQSANRSADPLVSIAWLIAGLDLWHRSGGTSGHSLPECQSYVLSSILNQQAGTWRPA